MSNENGSLSDDSRGADWFKSGISIPIKAPELTVSVKPDSPAVSVDPTPEEMRSK